MEPGSQFGSVNIHFLIANLDAQSSKENQKEHHDKVVSFLGENLHLLQFLDLKVLNNLHRKLISKLPESDLGRLNEQIKAKLIQRIYEFGNKA